MSFSMLNMLKAIYTTVILCLIISSALIAVSANPIIPDYTATEKVIESGLSFIDYFYPPNCNNKFYTGILDNKKSLVSKAASVSNSYNPIFTQISNMVYFPTTANFFLCPSDNNLIWELPPDLSSAKGQSNFDTDYVQGITGLRCIADSDESLFFIAYVGHNTIYTFQFKIKSFTLYTVFEEGDKILEFASQTDRKTSQKFFVIVKNEVKQYYNIICLEYPGYITVFNYSYYLEELPLYQNVRISLNFSKTQMIVFSFNDVSFNYFFIDSTTGRVLKSQTANTIFNLTNVNFKEVLFYKMSDLMIYRMTVDGVDYYGVGDISLNLILFNKKQKISSIRSFQESDLVNTLAIARDTNLLSVTCPYAKSEANLNSCFINCPNGLGYIINTSGNLCQNCSVQGKKFYIRYCIDTCPLGLFPDTSNTCIKCAAFTPYYNKVTQSCVEKCPDYNSFDINNVCYKCTDEGKFYLPSKRSCVPACPKNWISDKDNGSCINCKSISQFYCGKANECCVACPANQVYDSDNVCYDCKSVGKFYLFSSKSCIDTCPNNSVKDATNFTCDICQSKVPSQFYLPKNNQCVPKCPDLYLNTNDNICYTCKSKGKFYYYGICLDKCPNDSVIDNDNNVCTSCKKQGKFLVDNKCVDACPLNYLYDSDQVCYTCKSRFNTYYDTHQQKCVSSCSSGSSLDEDLKICTPCQPEGKFLLSNTCVSKCPDYNIVLTDNICYSCKDNNKFYVDPDDKCVDSCDSFMKVDLSLKVCYNCKAKGKFLSKNECVDKCEDYYIWTNDNICYSCKYDRNGMFLSDSLCVAACPEGAKIDTVNNVCTFCGSSNLFYLKDSGNCVDKCPDGYLVNKSKRCYTCKETDTYFYKDQCITQCPAHCAIDSTKNVCNCCVDNGQFFYNNSCLSTCPVADESVIILQNNVCHSCKDEGKYLLDGKCVDNCSSLAAVNEDKKTCDICVNKAKFLYPKQRSQCLDKCPPFSKILEGNVCQLCQADLDQFFFDKNNIKTNTCLVNCPDYVAIDNEKKTCKSCLDYNQWLFENTCIPQCNFCKFDNNVCQYCNHCQVLKQIKFGDICVDKCPLGTILNNKNECIKCTDTPDQFYLNNKCLPKCPPKHFYKDDNLCISCNQFIYDLKCIASCPYNFGVLSLDDNLCANCKDLNKFSYGIFCVSQCPKETITDNVNKVCVNNENKCNDTCNGRGKCRANENKCDCELAYSGDFCEVSVNASSNFINVIQMTKILKSKINIFTYSFANDYIPSGKYSIYWNVHTVTSESYYLTGRTEKNLKLAANSLKEGVNTISLLIKDEVTQIIHKSFVDVIITSLDPNRFSINVKYFSGDKQVDFGVSMKTLVVIEVIDKNKKKLMRNRILQNDQESLFSYKFFYVDSFGQELEITEVYITTSTFARTIPNANQLILEVKDSRGQSVRIAEAIDVRFDDNYSTSLDDILNLNSNKTTPSQQLLDLNNFMSHQNNTLDESKVLQVSSFLSNSFDSLLSNNNSTISHSSILAVYNQLVINQSKPSNTTSALNNLNHLLLNFTSSINSLNASSVSQDDLKGYYTSMDFIFDAYNQMNYTNNTGQVGPNAIKTVQSSISNINQFLSRALDVNERVVVSTKNFDSYIERPGTNQKEIEFEEVDKDNKTFKNYNDYGMGSTEKKDGCGSSTYLCVNGDNMDYFKKHLNATANGYSNIAIFAVNINNKNLYNGTSKDFMPLSTTSFSTSVYDTRYNSTVTNANFLNFDVSLKIPPDTNQNITGNSACVSIQQINKQIPTCLTYYNYTSNRTICRCSGSGEFGNIYNYALSNIAKLLQFPEWSLDLINPLSTCLVIGSLTIVIVFSIVLLLYDYYDDRNFLSSNNLDDHQIIHNEFKDMTSLCQANIFSFAVYITMYIYPFFSVFSIYNYNQPRFLRFSVEILSMIMSLSFSLLPYYNVPFQDKQIFVDTRDIEEASWSVDSLPAKLTDVVSTVLYSVFASIVISSIINYFSIMMRWSQLMFDVWKYRKNIINQYVRQYLIRPMCLPEKWKLLRMRILALNRLCGKWILKQHLKRESDKQHEITFGRKLLADSANNLKRRLLNNDSSRSREVCLELKNVSNVSNKKLVSFYDNDLAYDQEIFYMTKAENFSLNIDKNGEKKNKQLEKMNNIRLMYFKSKPSESKHVKYDTSKLKMFRLFQYSFSNVRPNKVLQAKFFAEKCNIIKSIVVALSLILIYMFFYFALFVLIADIYQRYNYYIIKVWLLPSLIQLVIVRFLVNYSLNLFKSFLLFKLFAMRKTQTIVKLLYKALVAKELVYMFKIRNHITRFEKQLREVKRINKEAN